MEPQRTKVMIIASAVAVLVMGGAIIYSFSTRSQSATEAVSTPTAPAPTAANTTVRPAIPAGPTVGATGPVAFAPPVNPGFSPPPSVSAPPTATSADMPPPVQLGANGPSAPGSVQSAPGMPGVPSAAGMGGIGSGAAPPPGVSTDVPAGMRSPAGPAPIAGY